MAHKVEHAVDMETGAVVGVTIQGADKGDTTTLVETLVTAAEQVEAVLPAGSGVGEVVADKGYHSNRTLVDLAAVGVRSYVAEPGRGRRNWKGRKAVRDAVHGNRRRIRGERGRDRHRASALWLLVLGVVLILVVLPRFDRHDWGFIDRFSERGLPAREHLSDAGVYVRQVLWFRGVRDEPVVGPFAHRRGVPLVASWLPLAPLTAINVVNVALLQVGMVALWATLGLVTSTPLAQVLGTALYVVSFGTFYYGAIGFVDPAALGVVSVGMWLVVSQRWLGVAVAVAVGPFVKETCLALVPMVAGWLRYGAGHGWRLVAWGTVAAAGAGLLGLAGTGWIGGGGGRGIHGYSLSLDNAMGIFSRGMEILEMLLSLGVAPLMILVLLAHSVITGRSADSMPPRGPISGRTLAPFLAGASGAGAFVVWGWLCCSPGGRIVWMASLFLIPVAMIMLDRVVQGRPNSKP